MTMFDSLETIPESCGDMGGVSEEHIEAVYGGKNNDGCHVYFGLFDAEPFIVIKKQIEDLMDPGTIASELEVGNDGVVLEVSIDPDANPELAGNQLVNCIAWVQDGDVWDAIKGGLFCESNVRVMICNKTASQKVIVGLLDQITKMVREGVHETS